MKPKLKAKNILKILKRRYPEVRCALDHENPFELLVSTALSAQCTDKQVNKVTPALFERYPSAMELSSARVADVRRRIRAVGLFDTKSKNLVAMAKLLVKDHGAEVPRDRESLEKLPGVGRKTANVVLSNAFDFPALAVDTHVKRLSGRLGLSGSENVDKIEKALCELFPKEEWRDISHRLIQFGRDVCDARKPRCDGCELYECCDYRGGESPRAR
ncbi:MAG: endonuclease III [Planctomycetes bacterium]|nr:endonuclease III [Planctomycetota bacterium]